MEGGGEPGRRVGSAAPAQEHFRDAEAVEGCATGEQLDGEVRGEAQGRALREPVTQRTRNARSRRSDRHTTALVLCGVRTSAGTAASLPTSKSLTNSACPLATQHTAGTATSLGAPSSTSPRVSSKSTHAATTPSPA